jgi:arabinofuranosyltransferase
MTSKRATAFSWILILLGGLLVGGVFADFHYDDPFFTFRYVQNLLAGRGWVYNTDVALNASTSPLHTLTLAAAALVDADLPQAANILFTAWNILAAAAAYLLLRRDGSGAGALCAACLLLMNPLILLTYGKETTLVFFLVGLSLLAYQRGAMLMTGVALGLLFLARPDTAWLAVVILVDRRLTTRRVPWKPALAALAVVLPWLAFSWWKFGSLFPASLGSKSREGQLLYGAGSYLLGHLYWWEYLPTAVCLLPTLIVAALGGWATRGDRIGRMIVAWVILHVGTYALIHPPPYMSYYTPIAYTCVLLAGRLLQRLDEPGGYARRFAKVSIIVLLAAGHATSLLHFHCLIARKGCDLFGHGGGLREWDYLFYEHDAYAEVGKWLRANTPAETVVGVFEAGIIGYYSERTMTDKLGVVTPDALTMSNREWLERYRPDFVAFPCDFPFVETLAGSSLRYVFVQRFRFDTYIDILVYRRVTGPEARDAEDDSPIAVEPPLYDPSSPRPPTLRWTGHEPAVVDLFFLGMLARPPLRVDLWYRTSDVGPLLTDGQFVPAESLWGRVPPGQPVFWRVRTVRPEPPYTTVARSRMFVLVK